MSKPIELILAPKPQLRPRIYAYSIDDNAHKGLLKLVEQEIGDDELKLSLEPLAQQARRGSGTREQPGDEDIYVE